MPALVTEAVLPVEPAQTDDEAVIAGFGAAMIVTSLFPDDALQQLLLVMVTVSVTEPDAPAV